MLTLMSMLSIDNLVEAQILPVQELESIQWLIQQHQLDWNINGTTCEVIQGTSSSKLTCFIFNGQQGVSQIYLSNATSSFDQGYPNPNLTSFGFNALNIFIIENYQMKNKSLNTFAMLDSRPSFTVLNTLIIKGYGSPNIYMNPKWWSALKNLTISILDTSISIPTYNITYIHPDTAQFDYMCQVNIETIHPMNLTFNMKTINTFNVFNRAPQNKVYASLKFDYTFYFQLENVELLQTDFSQIQTENMQLTNVNEVTGGKGFYFQYKEGHQRFFPKLSWFVLNKSFKAIGVDISDSTVGGTLTEDFSQYQFYRMMIANTSITGQMPQYFCQIPLYNSLPGYFTWDNVNFSNIPDCFYCYYSQIKDFFAKTTFTTVPASFKCDVRLFQTYFIRNSPTAVLPLKGVNLGFGADPGPSITMRMANTFFDYKPTLLNGNDTVVFSKLFNYKVNITWVTDISTLVSVYGQKLFQYYYVNVNGTFDQTLSYQMVVNGHNCTIKSMTNTSTICYTDPSAILDVSQFNNVTLITPYQNMSVQFKDSKYPIISSASKTTVKGGPIDIYGTFGSIFNYTSVMINQRECNITLINSSSINCNIAGDLRAGLANLTLVINSEVITLLDILLVEYDNTTAQCVNPDVAVPSTCSGNGQCVTGLCHCLDGFGGYYCDSVLDTSGTVLINSTLPSMTIESNGVKFELTLVAFEELGAGDEVVYTIGANKWLYNKSVDGVINRYNYHLVVADPNQPALDVSIQFEIASVGRAVEFAGVTSWYPAGSLKMVVNINRWHFGSNLNTLRVVFSNPTPDVPTCQVSSVVGKSNIDRNVQYIKIVNNGVTFYGYFLPLALSDGRPAYSRNEYINVTTTNTFIGIRLPQCERCTIDPAFSVLVNGQDELGPACGKKEFQRLAIILIAVFGGVVLLSLVIGASVYFIRRRKHASERKRIAVRLQQIQQPQPST
ncbi:hypothetical protein SAMD00019534_025200 [Acytostelium subglobosum LB1]|uniref:hypothetical protein n=1 Tax=Acytostelium subglobosum LB1 TaxID=1410327 RepID=UPI000644D24B|nr:hypothetical protein SAMD00019534_025200 [Acytostelium subglobosum LB1]GAM19345.1 hypothetical protein SAMD00019534_025200 [Acytostelium subglobosum LB1]|eukprot:XP_012757272.1 hypothetical protein SAMD00019534_025200 [Acytostelium subglobosum LB1]